MIIKPCELANLCSIFYSLKIKKISTSKLFFLITSSLSIDSVSGADDIISEAEELQLLEIKDKNCYITNSGYKIAKLQSALKIYLSDAVKENMIKLVYLNSETNNLLGIKFIKKFYPDSEYGTFVCDRSKLTSSEDIKYTLIFQRLDLLIVFNDVVTVNKKYLGFINNILLKERNIDQKIYIESAKKKKIGDIAENLAFDYEKNRLINNGYPELSNLVQKISEIDYSAGYDIVSFKGKNKNYYKPIYIEVKGTEKDFINFFWTVNERNVASQKQEDYYLYIYTDIEIAIKNGIGPTIIKNPIEKINKENYIIEPQDLYIYKKKD